MEFAASVTDLSHEKPVYTDQTQQSIWLLGEVQAGAFNRSDRGDARYHAIVWKGGRAKANALFVAHATDLQVHQALLDIGAAPGNNLTLDSWDERFAPDHADPNLRVTGSVIEISVQWEGSQKVYDISEILVDAGGGGFSFRFGGNLKHIQEWKSGCVACLYSCPGGKVSNASYTIRDYVDEATRFQAREDLLPPDGSEVRLILRLKE